MGSMLDALHALQEIERKLATIHGSADAKRGRVKNLQRGRQKQELLIEEGAQVVQKSQMEIDGIDLDVQAMEQTLAKHREALNRAKTNKEYAAILTSINTEKADNTKLETRQLALMADVDVLRSNADETEAEVARIDKRIALAESALEDHLDGSAAEIKDLERKRDDLSEDIAASTMSVFRRVAERHDGEAMAEVTVLDIKRQKYTCGGCNMSLTLQQVIGCKQSDDIVLCGSCGKILYFEH